MRVGAGYDRALDVERPDCFARAAPTTTTLRQWEATGFTAFTSVEVLPKVEAAIVVGVKVQGGDGQLGTETAQRVGSSGEQARFVALARYTARRETAGATSGATATCSAVPTSSANGLEDFVTACGDSFLAQKSMGGHVLLSWRRTPARASIDELMGTMLGARTVGATFDLRSNLDVLSKAGLGEEEVFIETSGLPLKPSMVTLPNGSQGFTIDSAAEYLRQVTQLNPASFLQVTEYGFTRYDVAQVDQCLASTGRQSSVPQSEWECVHGHLSELVDARDGTGELAHFQDKYLEAKLVSEQLVPAKRVVFNTVAQSRCPGIDQDGDPNFEASGPCQAKSVADFVAFYEACVTESAALLADCRNDVLETVDTCGAFEAKDCKARELTLSSGTKVTCSEAGMAAAMADMVPWQVNPPFAAVQAPRHFQPPITLLINEPIFSLPVTPQTHFCALTGLRGDIQAGLSIEEWNTEWRVMYLRPNPEPAFKPQLEVTCTAWENFYFFNGGSHTARESQFLTTPVFNGSGFTDTYTDPGVPFLAGVWGYLNEPQSEVFVTNPDASGFGSYYLKDLFPLASPAVVIGTFTIQSNPPLSGAAMGGSLVSVGVRSELFAGFGFPGRNVNDLSSPLDSGSFCFLTGLSGRYFNVSDWGRVDGSDGFTTLRVSTPLTKDRNPGIRVQCIRYDQP